jgi:uncharacterized protein
LVAWIRILPDVLNLAATNLLSPVVLFFALGAAAAFARSDLTIPEAVVKGMSLYLLLAIGFKGGVAARAAGLHGDFVMALLVGLTMSVVMPLLAFFLLFRLLGVSRVTAAGTAAHYGSISIVTFVAATDFLKQADLAPAGYMAAIAAAMETPGIVIALVLAGMGAAKAGTSSGAKKDPMFSADLLREVMLNGSVVVLIGAFAIGVATGDRGMARLDLFVNGLFQGVLCLFMLDMGLLAARRLSQGAKLTAPLFGFGLFMPLIGAATTLALCAVAGIGPAEGAILVTLAASASYIAAPAAMRIALPEADAGVYLPLALGVTFPFNLVFGIPLYAAAAQAILG